MLHLSKREEFQSCWLSGKGPEKDRLLGNHSKLATWENPLLLPPANEGIELNADRKKPCRSKAVGKEGEKQELPPSHWCFGSYNKLAAAMVPQ
jgi:hypothetical protein